MGDPDEATLPAGDKSWQVSQLTGVDGQHAPEGGRSASVLERAPGGVHTVYSSGHFRTEKRKEENTLPRAR